MRTTGLLLLTLAAPAVGLRLLGSPTALRARRSIALPATLIPGDGGLARREALVRFGGGALLTAGSAVAAPRAARAEVIAVSQAPSDDALTRELLRRTTENRARNDADSNERTLKNQRALGTDPFKTELVEFSDGTWTYITRQQKDQFFFSGRLEERSGLLKVRERKGETVEQSKREVDRTARPSGPVVREIAADADGGAAAAAPAAASPPPPSSTPAEIISGQRAAPDDSDAAQRGKRDAVGPLTREVMERKPKNYLGGMFGME